MKKLSNLILLAMLSLLVACSGGGGGGVGGGAVEAPTGPTGPTFSIDFATAELFSNTSTSNISGTMSGLDEVSLYSDNACTTLIQTIDKATFESGVSVDFTFTDNAKHDIYAIARESTQELVTCVKVFEFTHDNIPPTADPTLVDPNVTALNGTTATDSLVISGDPTSFGPAGDSEEIVFYADAGKTQELGRVSLAEYQTSGAQITVPGGLQNGVVPLFVAFSDKAGNTSATLDASTSFTHDNIPPAAPILAAPTASLHNSFSSSITSLSLDFTVDDTDTSFVRVYPNGLSSTPVEYNAGAIPVGGNIVHPITVPTDSLSNIILEVEDAHGNLDNTVLIAYTHDATNPQAVTLDAATLALEGTTTGGGNINIVGTIEAGTDLEIRLNGSGSADFTIDSTTIASGYNLAVAPDQANSIVFRVVDAAGNVSTDVTLNITDDSVPPAAPTVNALTARVNTNTINISGTHDGDTATVAIYSDAGLTTEVASFSAADLVAGYDHTLAQNQLNDMYIAALDAVGNKSTAVNVSTTHDNLPPTLSISAPLSFTNNATSDVTANFTNDATTVELYDDAIKTNLLGSFTTSGAETDYTFSAMALTNGSNEFHVFAVDDLGNESTDSMTIVRDAVAPNPPVLNNLVGLNVNDQSATPTINVSSDETDGTMAFFTDSGCTSGIALAANSVTSLVQDFTVAAAQITEGSYTIYANHTDLAGNTSACSAAGVSYTYDITPPALTSNFDTGGANISIATPLSSWDMSGTCEIDGQNVEVSTSTTLSSASVACSGGAWSLTLNLTAELDAAFDINVTHTDLAGNTNTITTNHEKDMVAPANPILNTATLAKQTNGYTNEMCATNTVPCVAIGIDTPGDDATGLKVFSDAGLTTEVNDFNLATATSSAEATLTGNSANTLYLATYDAVGNLSGGVSFSITHDNIAPTDPVLAGTTATINTATTNLYTNQLHATIAADTVTVELHGVGGLGDVLQTKSKADYDTDVGFTTAVSPAGGSFQYYISAVDIAGNRSTLVSIDFTHNIVLPTIAAAGHTVTPNNSSTAVVNGANEVIINPNEMGTITLNTGTSSEGFDIVSHNVDLSSATNISNCTNTSATNPTEIVCDYDFTGVAAPEVQTINYTATDEHGASSTVKSVTVELNEGPQ